MPIGNAASVPKTTPATQRRRLGPQPPAGYTNVAARRRLSETVTVTVLFLTAVKNDRLFSSPERPPAATSHPGSIRPEKASGRRRVLRAGYTKKEGGASGALPPGRVFPWAGVRVGRGPERPGAALAGDGGQRPGPRDVEGSPVGLLRAGAVFVGAVAPASPLGCGVGAFGNCGEGAVATAVAVERRGLAESGRRRNDVGLAPRTHQRPTRGPVDAAGPGSAGRADPERGQRFAQWE